jgi:hypothetical protein
MAVETAGVGIDGPSLALAPVLLIVAAWALQLACMCCAIEPPTFWRAGRIVVQMCVVQALLQLGLAASQVSPGLGSLYVVPLAASGAVIAAMVPASPMPAFAAAFVHLALCGALCLGLEGLAGRLAAGW